MSTGWDRARTIADAVDVPVIAAGGNHTPTLQSGGDPPHPEAIIARRDARAKGS